MARTRNDEESALPREKSLEEFAAESSLYATLDAGEGTPARKYADREAMEKGEPLNPEEHGKEGKGDTDTRLGALEGAMGTMLGLDNATAHGLSAQAAAVARGDALPQRGESALATGPSEEDLEKARKEQEQQRQKELEAARR